MISYKIQYSADAIRDLYKLDNSCRQRVIKAIKKVSKNPLPNFEGGLGKPLGVRGNTNLTGFLKIKLLKDGIRIVYKLIKIDGIMYIVVIGARSDDKVYDEASKRITIGSKHL